MTTEQEEFWAGDFGVAYTERNKPNPDATAYFFANATAAIGEKLDTIIELGANDGRNLVALAEEFPGPITTGVEINAKAYARMLANVDWGFNCSLFDLDPMLQHDLVLTKGLLIHIQPDDLQKAYSIIHRLARRWILIAEYYNPIPVELPYRGHGNKLWKRDFAGELLDAYSDLKLIDYGFAYHRDKYPQDDLTWFLLRKEPAE